MRREKVGRVRLELVQLRHKPCLGAASASRALMYFIYARIKGIAALERHGETQDVSQRTSCSSSSSFLSSLLVASREIVEGWKRGKGRGWLVARVDRNKKRAALALICKGISGITLSTLFSSSFSLSISLSLFHFFSFVLFLSDPNRDFFKKPSFHDLLG